jgi:HEAT repeat protein
MLKTSEAMASVMRVARSCAWASCSLVNSMVLFMLASMSPDGVLTATPPSLLVYKNSTNFPDAHTPTLAKHLRKPASPEEEARTSACLNLLARLGPAASAASPRVVELLKIPEVRCQAAACLARLDPARLPEALEVLLANLDSENAADRELALLALIELGTDARDAVPALRAVLRDPDSAPAGLDIVANLGPAAGPLVPELIGLLSDRRLSVSGPAGWALAGLGERAVPGLKAALSSPDAGLRFRAAVLLGRVGPPGRAAEAELRALLADPEVSVRLGVADTLGRIGSDSQRVVEVLRGWLGGFETDTRQAAASVLGRLGSAALPAVPDLISCLCDPDLIVRAEAARALGRLGQNSEEVRSNLRSALLDQAAPVRLTAAEALIRLDPATRVELLPAIQAGLVRLGPELTGEAAELLVGLDVAHLDQATAAVERTLREGGTSAVRAAQLLLKLAQGRRAEWLNWLLALARSRDTETALAALDALGSLGKEAEAVLPELLRWPVQKNDPAVLRAVTGAVRRISPG